MKKKIILFSGIGVVLLWLIVEALSIESWSATTTFGKRIGIIEYRNSWGEFNRVTMSINEAIFWIGGYSFDGPSMHGDFGQWMHTYTKDVN